MPFSKPLLEQKLWSTINDQHVPASPESIQLHYDRARSMCQQSGLTIGDIQHLTPKFWDFHFDLIATRDMTAFIIATIHLNLCIRTLSSFSGTHPDLQPLLDDLLSFKICGEFMLTEVGHGLDARNIETTATLLPNGCFDLHSPSPAAWKAMPPTTPQCGMPRVSVVFARLIVKSKDHGIKPFIVWLSDSERMCTGITSRVLPTRPGTKPLDHAITSFDHVPLPPTALLGSISKAGDLRADFLQQIWRVSVGTLSLSIMGVSSITVASSVAAMYSRRRLTTASDGEKVPIFNFSTQHRPILRGLVSGAVLEAFARWTIQEVMNTTHSQTVRHALATVFKATVIRDSHILNELSDRCGWQGLFHYNQIIELAMTFRGNSIAEGDALVLCVRLASELLGHRYALPKPKNPDSAIARHESGLFCEAEEIIADLGGYGSHRSQAFNERILPRCRSLIEAVGHRMAYEATQKAGLHPAVLYLYEKLCISADLSWYVENGITTRSRFSASIDKAYQAALPVLMQNIEDQEVKEYITAAIITSDSWGNFVQGLYSFQSIPRAPVQSGPKL